MKKKRIWAGLLVLAAILLSACAEKDVSQEPEDGALTYAALNKPSEQVLSSIEDFNENHPDTPIEILDYSDEFGLERLRTELALGRVPDIIEMYRAGKGADMVSLFEIYEERPEGEYWMPYRQMAEKGYLEDLWLFYFTTEAPKLDAGLLEVLDGHLKAHPATRLMIVDTLQKVRGQALPREGAYAQDYREMETIKGGLDKWGVSVLFVHHNRKMKDVGGLCGEIEQRRRGPAAQHFIHAVLEAVQAVLQSEVQHARPGGRPAQERLPGRDAEAQVQHHPALADFGGGGQEAGPLRQDAIHQELDRRQVRFLEVRGGYHLQGLDLFRFALCSVAVRFRGPAPLIPAGPTCRGKRPLPRSPAGCMT